QAESKSAFCGMIGGSEAMQRVYQAIQAVANSNTSVILRGESGTGKELIAGAIAQTGRRSDKPYVCLNCSAIPESLIESELFGYEKGAFTGADAAKPGLIEAAQGGTLFLDEITTLDQGLQSKLLRVLQEHIVQRLVLMNDSPIIRAEHLPQQLVSSSTAGQEAILIPEEGVDFDAEIERIELAYLNAALRRTGGRKTAAAALLRIDPQRMKYLCRRRKVAVKGQ